MTAWATTSAAASVISPKERLSSWRQETEQSTAIRLRKEKTHTDIKGWTWWWTDLEDWQSLSEHCGEGDGSFRADQAVTEVDHLYIPQVSQSLYMRQKTTCTETIWFKHTGYIPTLFIRMMWPGLTCAMASVPLLVKVLSLKLRTRSSGLCRIAEANAITPA